MASLATIKAQWVILIKCLAFSDDNFEGKLWNAHSLEELIHRMGLLSYL